jgi:glycosyltransferase involved in cell wall biosynthesis
MAARRAQLPYIVAPRGMLETWALKHRWLKKKLAYLLYQRRDLARAARIHATSPGEVASIERLNLGVPIELITNAVDLPALDEQVVPNRASTMRRALFLSRIHPVKGLENLIRAWCKLQKPGWECWIVGPGEMAYVSQLKQLCQDLGGASTMSFHAGVSDNDKWEVLRTADLFVSPSHSENFGMAIAEALGCGIPVITTRNTPWEEIETNSCGWWIEGGQEALESALSQAMSISDSQRQQMGKRGSALISNKYCWPAAARKIFELYGSLLK